MIFRIIISDLIRKHIYRHEKDFYDITEQLICEIKEINNLPSHNIILEEKMLKFDEVFNMHQEQSLVEFINICHKNELLNKMTHVCEEMRSNLARLIYIARKSYKDRLKYQIKTVLTEINLSENIQRFQERISHNIDIYLDLNDIEQKEAFEEIWEECFGDNGRREEGGERNEDFDNLYTIFKMESKTMDDKQTIHDLIHNSDFNMVKVIDLLRQRYKILLKKVLLPLLQRISSIHACKTIYR